MVTLIMDRDQFIDLNMINILRFFFNSSILESVNNMWYNLYK